MWLTQGIEGGMPRTLRYVLWAIEGSLEFHLAVLWRVRKQSLGPLLNESAEGWGIVQSVLLFDTEMIHSKFWMNAFLDTCKAFIFSLLLCTHHWIGCSTLFSLIPGQDHIASDSLILSEVQLSSSNTHLKALKDKSQVLRDSSWGWPKP